MAQTWYIDDSRLEVRVRVQGVDLLIDDGAAMATIPGGMAGRFAVPWKKREVEVRRVGPARGLETEVWVDEVYVPTGSHGPKRGKASECVAHGKRGSRRCPECDAVLCKRCTAVDGVRCDACFDRAASAERSKRKRAWLLGAAFCFVVAVLSFWGAGAGVTGHEYLPKVAGTMLFATGLMAWTGLRQHHSHTLALAHPSFVVDPDPPQLVGQTCAACKKRIGSAKDADWCERCRGPYHASCLDEHRCRQIARGPDWNALEAS